MTNHRSLAVAVVAPMAIVALCVLVAPVVRVPLPVAEAMTFGGAVTFGIFAVSLGARLDLPRRIVLAVLAVAALVLASIAVASPRSPWVAVAVDGALVAVAWSIGASIGARVQHPAHLLPASAVAAAADVVSVASSFGPSRAIAESERALSVLAVSFPVPGTHVVAPALGVGDLIFVSLLLGASRVHRLPYRRVTLLAWIGAIAAGVASARLRMPVPALPTIALSVVAFVPETRRVARKDRTVTTIAIGVALFVALWAVITARVK